MSYLVKCQSCGYNISSAEVLEAAKHTAEATTSCRECHSKSFEIVERPGSQVTVRPDEAESDDDNNTISDVPEFGGYEFEGPYRNTDEIQLKQGVYVIVCLVDGQPHCVLDIGTSGQLKERLSGHHDRQDCWQNNVHGDIGYCVKYTGTTTDVHHREHAPPAARKSNNKETKERLLIEDELQWKYDVPCGTNHWKQKEKAIARYKAYERLFGPRGHKELR